MGTYQEEYFGGDPDYNDLPDDDDYGPPPGEDDLGQNWLSGENRGKNLNPDQFTRGFHGTAVHGLDKILPADEHGGRVNFGGMSDTSRSYFVDVNARGYTAGEQQAWSWAGDTPGRSVVYETEPKGAIQHDENMGSDEFHYTASHQDVVREINIPPPDRGSYGVQGTLPPINWNQFKAPGEISGDANHKHLIPSGEMPDIALQRRVSDLMKQPGVGSVTINRGDETPEPPKPQIPGQRDIFGGEAE